MRVVQHYDLFQDLPATVSSLSFLPRTVCHRRHPCHSRRLQQRCEHPTQTHAQPRGSRGNHPLEFSRRCPHTAFRHRRLKVYLRSPQARRQGRQSRRQKMLRGGSPYSTQGASTMAHLRRPSQIRSGECMPFVLVMPVIHSVYPLALCVFAAQCCADTRHSDEPYGPLRSHESRQRRRDQPTRAS